MLDACKSGVTLNVEYLSWASPLLTYTTSPYEWIVSNDQYKGFSEQGISWEMLASRL